MRFGQVCAVVVAVATLTTCVGGRELLAGQAATRPAANAKYRPPRAADGKADLQGIWQVRNTAGGDIQDHNAFAGFNAKGKPFPMTAGVPAGRGVVVGDELPYLPAAAAKQKENFANRFTLDSIANCYMPGVPRATYMGTPFQIFQTPNYVAITYEYAHTYRIIYTNGTPHVEGIEFWMGDSRGRWDGDTLVVDVTNFNDKTWFDAAGNHHSDALHVVERYTRTSANMLEYEATIEDPKVFTRPWKMTMPIYRVSPRDYSDRLLEYDCQTLAEVQAGTFVPGKREP